MKTIDLSDKTIYPANVLSDLDYVFALGDDSENMLSFLQGRWTLSSFHWGWHDIGHEEAVNSEFLYRAICKMNIQNRKRRDAMIACEGCRFVWLNKDDEPVPEKLSGEEFCDYMNRLLESDLTTIKNINASEDREIRRWNLDPSYEDLMIDYQKSDNVADYYHKDLGCGMIRFSNRSYGNKQLFIVNTILKKAFPIRKADGALVGIMKDDIDWDSISELEHTGSAYILHADYCFFIDDYKDGVARVEWMLYPDGRYFADEDGFGMEDNDEVNIYGYIDTECRVVTKFHI